MVPSVDSATRVVVTSIVVELSVVPSEVTEDGVVISPAVVVEKALFPFRGPMVDTLIASIVVEIPGMFRVAIKDDVVGTMAAMDCAVLPGFD